MKNIHSDIESALQECRMHRDTLAGQAFMKLFALRLEGHRDVLTDVGPDQVQRIQGRAQEMRDIIKKLRTERANHDK